MYRLNRFALFFVPALVIALVGLGDVALAQDPSKVPVPGTTDPKTPEAWFVYTVIGIVLGGILLSVASIKTAIAHSNFSLSDALSEEVTVTENGVQITKMVGSVSRVIALMGGVVLVLMFVGFGSFVMYQYAMGSTIAASLDALKTFMTTGLTLFAPYAVNKVSGLVETATPSKTGK